jgi:hypothetical protein
MINKTKFRLENLASEGRVETPKINGIYVNEKIARYWERNYGDNTFCLIELTCPEYNNKCEEFCAEVISRNPFCPVDDLPPKDIPLNPFCPIDPLYSKKGGEAL